MITNKQRKRLLVNLAMDALCEIRGRSVDTVETAEPIANEIADAWLRKYDITYLRSILMINDDTSNKHARKS